MTAPQLTPTAAFERALDARDVRFDGVFFVGITTTGIYCRPVCPARVSDTRRRRFFASAAAAERAGFRPCLRCRPELAPGRAACDAVSRLAHTAARRIAAGALNGRSVADLARELAVSERHLRRALEREVGAGPLDLARTHRLLLAKRLLADTTLSVTRIAYASGFQSLRRFNSAFREQYRMPPSAMRRPRAQGGAGDDAPLRLTLAYRPPFAWEALLASFWEDAVDGVEVVLGRRYGRTVRLDGCSGVVFAAHEQARGCVTVDISSSLVPALMPLLARLRHLFDLDAEPAAIDAHLAESGLGPLVARRPGLRLPGAVDGFEVALRELLGGWTRTIVHALGEPIETGTPALGRLMPDAACVAGAGEDGLAALGVRRERARALAQIARLVADGSLRLEPGSDPAATHRLLAEVPGVGDRSATAIVLRALSWPDAFDPSDPGLLERAERWRPWRAYAAMHLRLADTVPAPRIVHSIGQSGPARSWPPATSSRSA